MKNNKPWPVEYADQLVIGNPGSSVAICCFWQKKEILKEKLKSDCYSIIGNLYSRAGINAMLRNILANPRIRHLVLTGNSLTDSEEALLDFFKRGVDDEWRIIGNGGVIDHDLPVEVLQEVRQHVQLFDLRGVDSFDKGFQKITENLKELPPFAEPRVFPKTIGVASSFPGEFCGFLIRQPSVFRAWREAVWTVMKYGYTSPTDYGLEQKEVIGLLSIIENPEIVLDNLPHWAPFSERDVDRYVTNFLDKEKKGDIAYNYGNRLQSYWTENQIDNVVRELERSKYSRRAVASLWDPDKDGKSKDPPCITTIQVVIRNSCLYLTGFIRSNDMFRAYPLNASALAQLQLELASRLQEVRVGTLSILSFSAHIYSDCWDEVEAALVETAKLRQEFSQDPRGSFSFRYDDEGFIVDHFNTLGDLVQTHKTNDAKNLTHLLSPFVSRIDHAMYLGTEINRLEQSFLSKKPYKQDKVK
jgi:thymidylate synthase